MKIKKKKLKSLSKLKEETQKVVNQYIRARDCLITTGDRFWCKCISCGHTKNADEIQAGHFVPQGSSSHLRYEDKNINGQCAGCNLYQRGNLIPYTLNIDKKWGTGTAEYLQGERHKTKIWKRHELEAIKVKFEKKIEMLCDPDWFKAHVIEQLKEEDK